MTTHKSKVLGMPFGTASNKLRKLIMYDMVVRLGMDTCYRCGTRIETPAEFSIDHKLTWEYAENPLELFMDVSNISFSHLACNVRASNREGRVGIRKAKDNKAWCNNCKKYLPLNKFWKNKSRFSGVQNRCKTCITAKRAEGGAIL